jgi:hypothetical protein
MLCTEVKTGLWVHAKEGKLKQRKWAYNVSFWAYIYEPCTQYDNTKCVTNICFRTVVFNLEYVHPRGLQRQLGGGHENVFWGIII